MTKNRGARVNQLESLHRLYSRIVEVVSYETRLAVWFGLHGTCECAQWLCKFGECGCVRLGLC